MSIPNIVHPHPGPHTIDASGLERGKGYFYTGYTELSLIDRGEGVDGNDFWYQKGFP